MKGLFQLVGAVVLLPRHAFPLAWPNLVDRRPWPSSASSWVLSSMEPPETDAEPAEVKLFH